MVLTAWVVLQKFYLLKNCKKREILRVICRWLFGSSVLTHKKEQQIKIEGEFKPTVNCLCATRRGFVAVYIEKVRSAECTCRQEVPAGDCRCFFQCEHQCLHDGQDVQVLCAYRRCAGVLGRGFVRSYLPCSSSWINWTAWIEFQKGEVAHDITLVSVI